MSTYLRFPAIRGNRLVFVSDDDLWIVSSGGGIARRLTSGLGDVARPALSPDGRTLAFISREEGEPEVHTMPSEGGIPVRRTYLGSTITTVGYLPDGRLYFVSNRGQAYRRFTLAYTLDEFSQPKPLPLGLCSEVAVNTDGQVALGRNTGDPARWKRYRGGTAGHIWIGPSLDGDFRRLLDLKQVNGNLAHPMWVEGRVVFVSDHEGIANLYSVKPEGTDLRRHTDHEDYFVRFPSTDGTRIAYQCGAEIWLLDGLSALPRKIAIDVQSPRTQRNRKFITADERLEDIALHPDGHSLAINARGKLVTMPLWEEAPKQLGAVDGVRYRLAQWLSDGKTVVTLSDESGEEALEVYSADPLEPRRRLQGLDLGRAIQMVASPALGKRQVALANHRHELFLIDLDAGSMWLVDHSTHDRITDPAFSPDGRWLAYSIAATPHTARLRVCDVERGTTHNLTAAEFRDFSPTFDPDGKYLYFLSFRVFDPVYDNFYFDLGFPRGCRPYAVALQKDTPHPFQPQPRGFGEKPGAKDDKKDKDKDSDGANTKKDAPKPVKIDFDGITQRVAPFPVPEGRYRQIVALKGKALLTAFPIPGGNSANWQNIEPGADGRLEVFDFETLEHKPLMDKISSVQVSRDFATMLVRAGRKLRALKAGEKPSDDNGSSRKSGWIDVTRIRLSVDPVAEWRQMYREAWRLMRDHFWVADMSGVDWHAVYQRYLPLLNKVGTRLEFSDLMWELQGELGTSHAYEMGGDHREPPSYHMGQLAADLEYDGKAGLFRIVKLVTGDPWDPERTSPLAATGADVKAGDTILAVGGQRVTTERTPQMLLVNQAGTHVEFVIGDAEGKNPRKVVVKTLKSDMPARYREWVETNRAKVHEATRGTVGYVHIPNMGPDGFAEFHRYYRVEVDRAGLIVDVRFNGGGHVSQLLLEKLARKRLGYDLPRYGEPSPYPMDSVLGPIVGLTNEWAGSDGDIFSHGFKLLKLGPLIGKRTWGGVIGIWPRHALTDGTLTTQPEFSFWFVDSKWGVENYGTDPDIDIEVTPQDYRAGRDPQLDAAITLILETMAKNPPRIPDFGPRPMLAAPKLPKRG